MKEFKLVLEIQLGADSPVEATELVEEWIKEGARFSYIVQDDETKEIFQVDLAADVGHEVSQLKEYKPLIK